MTAARRPPRRARVLLPADASQLAVARRFVRDKAEDIGNGPIGPSVLGDLQLIASELVTNALEHGHGATIQLELVGHNDAIGVAVHSTGQPAHLPEADEWTVAPVESIAGRGLGIVRRLADRVQLDRHATGVTVSAFKSMR